MSDELFDIGLQAVSLSTDLPDPIITVSGADSYNIANTADYPILGLSIHGKSTQDGTPTPDNPVDIVSVGDGGAVEVTSCGKNLLNPTLQTTTKNGVTCTNNGDGTYTLNGTATANVAFYLSGNIDFLGQAKLIGTPKDNIDGICLLQYTSWGGSEYFVDRGNGVICTHINNANNPLTRFVISINKDTICNNAVFKPMLTTDLTATYDDYEPYKANTASITTALPLCSVGDVCDELIYNADGTGKIVKHIGKYIFKGNENLALRGSRDDVYTYSITNLFQYKRGAQANVLCDKYNSIGNVTGEPVAIATLQTGETCVWNGADNCTIYFGSACTTLADFKNEIAGSLVLYELAESSETELTSVEMTALKQLQSYDSVTNIYNNSGADMTVKILRRDYDMQYVFWIEESQTWVCPIGGKWKIICVGGGASGGQQYGTGAILYDGGGTTSFGSILAADGGTTADKVTTSAVSGQCGYDGLTYGWAPSANIIGAGANSQAHGYGAGGAATPLSLSLTGPSGDKITKTASGLCGKIKSTIVDLAESQSVICTIGDGGVLDITDSALKQYLMAANPEITDVATTAATFTAAAGKGKKGVIIAQYLGY